MSFLKKIGDWVGDAVSAISLGLIDLDDDEKVKTNAEEKVAQDKKDNSKKRRKLYATSGGAQGEEVFSVGSSSRGKLFGN